jgi:hypothetical protein
MGLMPNSLLKTDKGGAHTGFLAQVFEMMFSLKFTRM